MAGLRLLNAPQPLPLLSASLVSRRLSAASGMSNLECFCFSRTPLFSSYYFQKRGPQHRNIVAIRSITVKAETIKADFVEADSSHKTWTGDEIRLRFLNFYASKGHEIMPSSSLVLMILQFC
ncbi:hypothetical protein HPP92_010847 [Vanilla planifolia]|uniref:Uncharacterized protein n=1 Tax=Vanilla planifolia TaxID=51239 RepID=A0A835QWG6_VANPL|nr:hypothetical protein HPP92_010847 [Vanilla planifolia]